MAHQRRRCDAQAEDSLATHDRANSQKTPGIQCRGFLYLEADRTCRSGVCALAGRACLPTSSRTWLRSRSRHSRDGRRTARSPGGTGRGGNDPGSRDGNGHGIHGRSRRPAPCRSSVPFGPRRRTARRRSSGPWHRSPCRRSRDGRRTGRSRGGNDRGSHDGNGRGSDGGRSRYRSRRPSLCHRRCRNRSRHSRR